MSAYGMLHGSILGCPRTLCHALLANNLGPTVFTKLDLQFLCLLDHWLYLQIRIYCDEYEQPWQCQCPITSRIRLHEVPGNKHIAQTHSLESSRGCYNGLYNTKLLLTDCPQIFNFPQAALHIVIIKNHALLYSLGCFVFWRLSKNDYSWGSIFKRAFISLNFHDSMAEKD